MDIKTVIAFWQNHPKTTSWIGAIFGWAAVDWLLAAQITAAILASLVSLCALILTGPQAVKKVRSWFNHR